MAEYIVDDMEYESYLNYVVTELLNLCGCYNEVIADDIAKVLLTYNAQEYKGCYIDALGIQPLVYAELILHILDHADLVEHGGNVRGSWLTSKGVEVATKIQQEIDEDAKEEIERNG